MIAFAAPDRRTRRRACLRNATASVVRPRLADGCFSPTMHKPSGSRLEASAALLLLGGVRPDVRPGVIVPPWLSA